MEGQGGRRPTRVRLSDRIDSFRDELAGNKVVSLGMRRGEPTFAPIPDDARVAVAYTTGGWDAAPRRFIIFSFEGRGFYWIRDVTVQSNYSSWGETRLQFQTWMPWLDELYCLPATLTMTQAQSLSTLEDMERDLPRA